MLPRTAAPCLAFTLLTSIAAAAGPAEEVLLGFDAAGSAAERQLEARYDATLDAANLGRWMAELAAHPHHVGSPQGKANAERIAELFRSWGYATRIERFDVLFPTPQRRLLEMVAPEPFRAALAEPVVEGDPATAEVAARLPPYNAYSVDGDVTGELVYVHYGVPEDYDELERRGISVAGKVVLARYGGSWRGIKPKVAAEKGAIGCILYSDPRDDGYFQGDAYPVGGYRPPAGVQRGSVADMPLFPGDPLTPFQPAVEGTERLAREAAPTLTKVPVLPISWQDALPLLRALGGGVAPEGWRGALPTTYHLGPGPARVHLALSFDWQLAPAYDVIAVLEGAERPDEWVVRGNHHDAWVNGATDPVSGQVAMLEEARAVAALTQGGWRPRRTVVYAAWGAEEPGLIGSVEWVEKHAAELAEKAVVYVNSDSNSRGFLEAGGSHTLEAFVNQVARDVTDPEKGIPVAERLLAKRILEGDDDERREAREEKRFRLEPLGSGSDYTPFLQHLGIASLNLSYGGEGHYGQYHSAYDTVAHYTRFMDPGYRYGVAQAQTAGRVVLRLADAPLLPFDFARLTETLGRYVGEVEKLADDLRQETAEANRRINDGTLAAVDDPEEGLVVPTAKEAVPYLNFAPLDNAMAALGESLERYTAARRRLDAGERTLSAVEQAALDDLLAGSERALTRPEGLPDRPWFVHHVYAPGFYTGYGVKTLPGVREAIEGRRWDEVGPQVEIAAGVLRALAAQIDRATALLGRDREGDGGSGAGG